MTIKLGAFLMNIFRILLKFVAFAVLASLFAFLLTLLLFLVFDQDRVLTAMSSDMNVSNAPILTLFYICITLGQLGALLFLYKTIEKKTFSTAGLNPRLFPKQFLQGCLWGIVLISCVFVLLWGLGMIQIEFVEFSFINLSIFFLLFLFVSASEELLFRTFTINLVGDTFGMGAALVVSSLLFALVHYTNPSYGVIPFLTILLGGVALGILYIKTQQLWMPLGFHLTWNYFQGTIFGFQVSGLETYSMLRITTTGNPVLTGGDFGIEGSILAVFVLMGCILFYKNELVAIFKKPLPLEAV